MICRKCKEDKPIQQFGKDKSRLGGLKYWCKVCWKSYIEFLKKEKPDYINGMYKKYRLRNPEKAKKIRSDYALKHKKEIVMYSRNHQIRKNVATPPWMWKAGFMETMRTIWAWCPKGYEVDHIHPLKGKLVSGLNVPWNLQYLKIKDNREKNNKFVPYVVNFV